MAYKTDKRNILYANLMEEAKVRLEIIAQIASGRGQFHSVIKREFCYLQLRMLCELVALSCLVAHGDSGSLQSHKVGKAYSADEILDRLTKLKPHFYPEPVTQVELEPNRFNLEVIKPSPFPKDELIALYGKTHRYLHRGTLKKMLTSDKPLDPHVDLPEIIGLGQKFIDLLERHVISIDSGQVMICVLKNPDDNDKVQVATAEAR